MFNKIIIHLVCSLAFMLLIQCAQVVPLSGGNKDTAPPKLIEALPANVSINFNSEEIILKFDEFIDLKDVNNQIIITPQLKIMPEFEKQGKTIKIKLLHQFLEPGTTYRIDFGRAIVDMHEGNVLENFSYVFSTGPKVDTLKISGTVTSAFNNKNVTGSTVVLYPNTNWFDSLVFKTKPLYVSKSNGSGDFKFYNLPPSKYLIYAIDDKNKNLVYDGESEQIAMLGPPMFLSSDTMVDLKMFKEEISKGYIKKTSMPVYGFGQLFLNKPLPVKVNALNPSKVNLIRELQIDQLKDTVTFLYKNLRDTLSLLVSNLNANKIDTVNLVIPNIQNSKKQTLNFKLNENQGKLNFKQNPTLTFSAWMDTSKYNLKALGITSKTDSLVNAKQIKAHWLSVNRVELKMNLKEGNDYKLKVLKDAFFNVDGISNDSVDFQFKTQSKSDFGKFNLKLRVTRQQQYVLQILNENENVIKEQVLPYTDFKGGLATIPFVEILPGNYLVKIIFDNNQNKKWDIGDVSNGRLPEPVIISRKKIKIISDWETEEEIILGEQD